MDFYKGKTVLITGSARGIGLSTARVMGSRGASIVLSDVLDERLEAARESLEAEGVAVMAHRADVTSPEECEALARAARERFGKVDVLVNNAGVSIVSLFEDVAPDVAKKLVDVNVMGSIYMTMACLADLKSSRGSLVFVSSVSGVRAIPTGSLYSASKAFVRSLAESLRLELGPYGIKVGVIVPGFTTTDPEKSVMKGDGSARPINRPPHDTPEGVAGGIARLVERGERELVLTPLGKATAALQRISPGLLDRILARTRLKD